MRSTTLSEDEILESKWLVIVKAECRDEDDDMTNFMAKYITLEHIADQ